VTRIAIIFNKKRKETTGIYYVEAFKCLGYEVSHYWVSQADGLKVGDYDIYLRIDDGEYNEDIPQHLKPAMLLASDTHMERPRKALTKLIKRYDLVFCSHLPYIYEMDGQFPGKLVWLPFACDPEIHLKLNQKKRYDIGFVGNDGGIPRKFLLQEIRERFPSSFLGNRDYRSLNAVYSASRIGFNYSIKGEINMRAFEIMSCGTMLLTNHAVGNGLDQIFEDGTHLVIYNSPRELFEKVGYYLTHPKEREKIASSGYERTIAHHTYEDRAKTIIEEAKKRKLI